ncbi:DNA modification methylase [Breznakia sp. PF5-3]|uniref:DNA-methyltransferase n=1 Tax=unclassified Breznakia TaxID=2623764 RepID=UPI002406B1F4|nr:MULTISPECIES: site-specific DNA-methyltransferase [unclassified Breznakia]MDF9825743.1 DNA modification methylase [Breznakia sp. PM6-1]MDF9836566.1 DNA modification methylase [Breznakia sp. PF5-3]MDF9838784.1 DNA modification methylase [Breznakia sp. PFB2-8]MDF9860802.1 DNA modification methylase [Breznakia sp. PH5-24]
MISKFKKNTIYLGDAYKLIQDIPDCSIDLIVTDPPYEIASSSGKGSGKISKALQKVTHDLEEARITSGINSCILDEFMRVMKKPNIYIWCNKKQIVQYLNFFVGKHKCSFEILVWIKSNPVPTFGRNYMNDKEFCLYFRKGISLSTTYESGKTYWITPTNVKDKKVYDHPTIKPLNIIETLISNSSKPGDIVLDCFLGSGTTAVAAKKLNRCYVGIEYSTKYFETSCRRVLSI